MDDTRPNGSNSRYRSGAIEIDAMLRSVLIDGTPARVGARAFDVLLALVERRERVVPKRELMDLVWPRLVVEEGNLLVHMVALRKLLGPRAIATIPGRGYRFVMPVDEVDSRGSADSAPLSVTVRGNMPASPALFGRAQDLDAVEALLREHTVVTIVGAGGIGKTCMALVAAAATRIELPDGRWWVELAPVTEGAQVPTSIAGALGMQLSSGRSPNEALTMGLASKSLLLVLDNCEHLADDVAPLIDLLRARAPYVRLLVTSQDNDIVMHMYEKLIREDRVGFENMAEVHNTLSEDLSFNRVIRLAQNAEGAALYMVHVSAATGVAAIAASRAQGYPIYGETLHQYLLYTAEDYKRPGGQMFHTYPSLKFAKDQEALWAATHHGAIQAIATDEVCCPLQVKLQGRRIDDTTGGNSGVEPRLSLMYTHMVTKRGYSLADFVGLTSANAARIMGLYPRKGALAIGSDADIVLLDPRAGRVLRKEDLHETDYTPWEGHEVAAWPSMTILRGKIVVDNGSFLASPSHGQFLPRKIGDDIRARPTL